MRLIRLIRRREILRIAIADSAGLLDQDQVGEALADTDRAAVLGALRVAETHRALRRSRSRPRVLVVAMGRQGGREIGYGSDADVMYVHRGLPGVPEEEAQQQAAPDRRQALQPADPAAEARHPGRTGAGDGCGPASGGQERAAWCGPWIPIAEYYRRWSLVWEAQALLRARPMAGDDELAADFVALIDPIRYPAVLSEHDVREVRRIKARVEAERLPRGADPARHLKLGRGGLSDVEWLAQLLQLQHAGRAPGAADHLHRGGPRGRAAAWACWRRRTRSCSRAWRLASRIRSANVIWTGQASDLLPSSRRDLEAVARWCGYEPGQCGGAGGGLPAPEPARPGGFRAGLLRFLPGARVVFERLFYGRRSAAARFWGPLTRSFRALANAGNLEGYFAGPRPAGRHLSRGCF